MIRKFLAPSALCLLAACSGNPLGEDPGQGGGGSGGTLLPDTVKGAVDTAALAGWNPGDATISIEMSAQDAAALSGNYSRNAAFDVGPYQAYTYQETTSNRYVVALVRKEGNAAGMIAVDAGQFANYHGGGEVWRADAFTMPTSGLGEDFDYAGTYVGLLNVGDPAPGGPGGTLNPEIAYRTTGRALITADFTQMRISGGVDNRTVIDAGGAALNPLADIALEITDITANGTFTDQVMRLGDSGWTSAGTYGGALSDDAAEIAVVLVFNPTSDSQLFEHGLMVLPNCTTSGAPACP